MRNSYAPVGSSTAGHFDEEGSVGRGGGYSSDGMYNNGRAAHQVRRGSAVQGSRCDLGFCSVAFQVSVQVVLVPALTVVLNFPHPCLITHMHYTSLLLYHFLLDIQALPSSLFSSSIAENA